MLLKVTAELVESILELLIAAFFLIFKVEVSQSLSSSFPLVGLAVAF